MRDSATTHLTLTWCRAAPDALCAACALYKWKFLWTAIVGTIVTRVAWTFLIDYDRSLAVHSGDDGKVLP